MKLDMLEPLMAEFGELLRESSGSSEGGEGSGLTLIGDACTNRPTIFTYRGHGFWTAPARNVNMCCMKAIFYSLVVTVAAGLAACGSPDCPAKSGYSSCGYCNQDAMTSSSSYAGKCTYCSGACGSDPCNPCSGGGGGCDTSWVSRCGTTSNGIQFQGQPYPKSCGSCPSGTHYAGDDNVTAGGPYSICMCNGLQ